LTSLRCICKQHYVIFLTDISMRFAIILFAGAVAMTLPVSGFLLRYRAEQSRRRF
jgi:hypothetical protein